RASFLLAFVAAMVAAGGVDDRGAALEPRIRSVYVMALTASGAPVTDLTAADFAVKEGGKARDVIRAGAAAAPMQIAILIDDDGTGLFRYGIAKFLDRLLGRAEVAV